MSTMPAIPADAPAPQQRRHGDATRRARRLWPLPALLAWASCWLAFALGLRIGMAAAVAWGLALALGGLAATRCDTRTRAAVTAGGFPLSWLALAGTDALPAWAWLLPLALIALVYPLRTWRDAPLFPTPAGALDGMADVARLAPGAHILDAGCGLGHGLQALRHAYPGAVLHGVEWSRPLAALARARCGWARVRRGDMWSQGWGEFELVYLFQRPESMEQALRKAQAELRPGAWLASLEFEAPGWAPHACLRGADGRPLWLYRAPLMPQARPRRADKALSAA